jgi:hypothetical protein
MRMDIFSRPEGERNGTDAKMVIAALKLYLDPDQNA